MGTIETLQGKLQMDLGNWVSNLTKANASLMEIGIGSVTVGTLIADLAKGAVKAGIQLATFPIRAAEEAGKFAEEMDHLSQRTGISTDVMQQWGLVLAKNNVGQEQFANSIRLLAGNLDVVRQAGIKLAPGQGVDEALMAIADHVQQLPDGFSKLSFMTQVFGRSAAALIPVFNEGSEAIRKQRMQAEQYGAVLSGSQLKQLKDLDDTYDLLAFAVSAFGRQVGSLVAGPLTSVVGKMGEWVGTAAKMVSHLGDINALLTDLAHIAGAKDVMSGKKGPLALPSPDDIAKMAEALGMMKNGGSGADGDWIATRVESLKSFLYQIRLLDEETKGAAIVKHTQAFDIPAVQKLAPDVSNRQRVFGQAIMDNTIAQQKGLLQLEQQEALELVRRNELSVMFGTTIEEQIANEKAGATTVATSTQAYQRRFETLQNSITVQDALARSQQQMYSMESGFLGASDAARQVAHQQQVSQYALDVALLQESLTKKEISEDTYNAKIQAMDLDLDTRRRQIVQQFPSFFESQMMQIVNSNAFSVSQIITSWTSGMANSIVHGGDFVKQAWQATEIAIVQGALNTTVQLVAQFALRAAQEVGITAATAASVGAINAAKNSMIIAGETATATATVSVWGGASLAIEGFFASTAAAFESIVATMVATVTAVGEFVIGVLSAIAEALSDTVFGIPWAVAILAGIVGIVAALAATGNLGFSKGGIGNFGSGTPATLHGTEAVIPLNSRGAEFMREAMGGSNGGSAQIIHTHVNLDGRQIALATARHTGSAWRAAGAPVR